MAFKMFWAIAIGCAWGMAWADENHLEAPKSRASTADNRSRIKLVPRASRKPQESAPSIRVNVGLTLIPVTVTDPFGAPVSGLTREDFRLFEDGVEQEIQHFGADDAPLSLGVVFDASRSMTGKLDQSRDAVARFFRTAMPGDEFFLIEFNDVPRMLSGFTSETEYIEKTLSGIVPKNWTALLDAVYLGMQRMNAAKNTRKALLILSDGADNHSRYTESEMRALVVEGDVSIYSIGLVGGLDLFKRHVRVLRRLAEETGGRLHEVEKLEELPEAVAKISATLRNQYILGFASNNPSNSRLYRKVEVKLNRNAEGPRFHATWRTGYYTPD